MQQGFCSFDDFWNLPHNFVDDVNYRRGGWSGVSRLDFVDGESHNRFYVKRQENQLRYSLRNPFGILTYQYEIEAIRRSRSLGLPAVPVACWGVRKQEGNHRAVVVTRAIECETLLDLIEGDTEWDELTNLLRQCGETLYRMHQHRIRHGALYPNHIFLDPETADMQLIDFEGSRQCLSVKRAMAPDLKQFLKRLGSMPKPARDILLEPYLAHHPKLLENSLKALETDS